MNPVLELKEIFAYGNLSAGPSLSCIVVEKEVPMRQPNGQNYASALPIHWGRVESARQELSSIQKRLLRAEELEADEETICVLEHRLSAAELVFEHQQEIAELVESGREDLVAKLAA